MNIKSDATTAHSPLYSSALQLLESLASTENHLSSAPVDVDKVAAQLGIRVDYDATLEDDGIIGQIMFEGDVPVVKINPCENSYNPRRRFTLAHEIGHYCLHSSKTKTGFTDSRKTMSRTESYWDVFESEANSFAAELLMPADLILDEGMEIIESYNRRHNTTFIPNAEFIKRMADRFDVSTLAMQYRLEAMGFNVK